MLRKISAGRDISLLHIGALDVVESMIEIIHAEAAPGIALHHPPFCCVAEMRGVFNRKRPDLDTISSAFQRRRVVKLGIAIGWRQHIQLLLALAVTLELILR
ncbi:hypothetical protein JCM15831A_03250 [Asaia astilbis]